MDTKISNAAALVENLETYKYYEDVETQIYKVIVKGEKANKEALIKQFRE